MSDLGKSALLLARSSGAYDSRERTGVERSGFTPTEGWRPSRSANLFTLRGAREVVS
jgi:hypothetical protein